jgi:hypothetical protein
MHGAEGAGVVLRSVYACASMSLGRGVAQSGSAPEWGSGGRWFKSSRPDQFNLRVV